MPRLKFTVDTRHDDARARFSIIRSAYLAGFAALGWNYILRPCFNSLRLQLSDPSSVVTAAHMFTDLDDTRTDKRILIVTSPDDLNCVAVVLGVQTVFLPSIFNPMTWDELAEAFSRHRSLGDQLNVRLGGKEMPWPRWPTYFLDRPTETS